jgi:hypothetical protein
MEAPALLSTHQHPDDVAADLRAAIARSTAPAYVVASYARIHPSRLSRLLRGHVPITADVRERILAAVRMAQADTAAGLMPSLRPPGSRVRELVS